MLRHRGFRQSAGPLGVGVGVWAVVVGGGGGDGPWPTGVTVRVSLCVLYVWDMSGWFGQSLFFGLLGVLCVRHNIPVVLYVIIYLVNHIYTQMTAIRIVLNSSLIVSVILILPKM